MDSSTRLPVSSDAQLACKSTVPDLSFEPFDISQRLVALESNCGEREDCEAMVQWWNHIRNYPAVEHERGAVFLTLENVLDVRVTARHRMNDAVTRQVLRQTPQNLACRLSVDWRRRSV
jgi:hypothetical protein